MNPYIQMFFTILASVLASGGFWTLIQMRINKKDAKTRLLVGLAHDRIIELGMQYIERGCIYQDEYENLNNYLSVLMNKQAKWIGKTSYGCSSYSSN